MSVKAPAHRWPVLDSPAGRSVKVLLVVGASLLIGWFPATRFSGKAAASSAFSGLAVANGARVSYQIQGFLIVDYIADLGATTAQASVDSLDSLGYAAEPYPGSTVLAGPGLALGGTPLPVNPPGYPLIAQSSTTDPSSRVQQGPVSLRADSTSTSSSASAQVAAQSSGGNAIGSTVSTAQVVYDQQSGDVDSTAVSDAQPSSFGGGVLVIGRVKATAEANGPGSGASAALTSDFEADGISVAGQSVSITPAGLALPGSKVALPSTDPVNRALSAANLKIEYVAPVKAGNEIRSAGIVVSQTESIPNSPSPGVLTVTFGEAQAQAQGGSGSVSSLSGSSLLSGTGTPVSAGSTPLPAAGATGPVSVAAAPDTAAAAPGASTTPLSSSSSPAVSSAPSSAVNGSPSAGSPGGSTVRLGGASAAAAQDHQQFGAAFYLILVLAAALAFGAIQFVRFFAVRLAWKS